MGHSEAALRRRTVFHPYIWAGTMEQAENLLRAVLDTPDADEPRLAYADWCDQQKNPQGAFIRLQLESAKAERAGRLMDKGKLDIRARELSGIYGQQWAGRVAERVEDFRFHRGFVELIRISGVTFLQNAAEIMQLAPIRHLNFVDVQDVIEELICSEHLRSIRSLSFEQCNLGDSDMVHFRKSTTLGELRWLSLRRNNITLDGADHLAASTGLPQLGYVNFAHNPDDPTDDYALDVGYINETWPSSGGTLLENRHGFLPWLRIVGETIEDLTPDRFLFEGAQRGQ